MVAFGVEFDVEHTSGNDAAFACVGQARILNGMFDVEKHTRPSAGVSFIHQDSAPLHKITLTLQDQIDNRIQKWMAGANKGGKRLSRWRHQRLSKVMRS